MDLNNTLAHLIPMIDLPAIVLVMLLLGTAWVMWRAQSRDTFDWAEALRDESGKVSALRTCVLGSFAISSWVVMHDALGATGTDSTVFLGYLATWSGSLVLREAAAKWNGQLPLTRSGGAP